MAVRGLEPGTRAALIINECQNGIVDPAYGDGRGCHEQVAERHMLERIAALAAVCREQGALVIHSTIVLRPDGIGTDPSCLLLGGLVKKGRMVEGRHEAEIAPQVAPEPGDVVSRRLHGLTPFHGTELEWILRERGVQTVIVTGVSTNVGIPGACLEAINRGFRAVVPEDCTSAAWPEAQEWQMRNTLPLLATVTTSDEVAAALRS